MQDTHILGTGNSRSISSVPNFLAMYPTYEAFAQALIAGEVPIDIGPLNPAGCDVVGTANNKANLLSDATGGALGASTVNEALAALSARDIVYTSYIGTGTYTSENNPVQITFQYAPKFVMIPYIYNKDMTISSFPPLTSNNRWIVDMSAITTEYREGFGFGQLSSGSVRFTPHCKKSPDGKTLYWYMTRSDGGSSNYTESFNDSRFVYRYIAIT